MLIKNKLHWVVRKYLDQAGEGGDPGGGAPAPAPAPAPAGGPQGVEGGGVDWGGLNDGVDPGVDDDGLEDDGSQTPASQVPPVGDGQQGQPKVATPENPDPDNPEPQVDPEADPNAELQPDPDQPQPLTPEQQEEAKQRYQEWRTAEEARLEEHYQFSEDEVAALQTEPERVLPKMAAKLFMDVQEAAIRSVVQMLPQVVGQVNQTQSRDAQASQAFVNANPDLGDKKYHADIMAAAKTFRQRNPKATPQEAIKKIGQMVRALHDLPTPQVGEPAPAPAPAGNRRPAAPPKPHKPAAAGAAPVRAPAPKTDNVWAGLLDEDDD